MRGAWDPAEAVELWLARRLRIANALLRFGALIAFSGLSTAAAAGETYRIDPERTAASFAVTQFGFDRQRGRLGTASGTIVVDRSGNAGGSIDVAIDLATVDTGWDLRDEFLRGERMFDVAHYPVVRFRSARLEYRDGNVVAADGEITLHGTTKPARLTVRTIDCGPPAPETRGRCDAVVTGRLSRREFGMGFAWPLVGDDVELDLAITAVRVEEVR